MCDVCQHVKSHQLPLPKSFSMPQAPLELVFLDVWGPTAFQMKKCYYVSFYDDYNKFS